MSEEERKEKQIPKISKLAIKSIICCILSIVTPVVGVIYYGLIQILLTVLLDFYPSVPLGLVKSVRLMLVLPPMVLAPLLFVMAGVIYGCASLIEIIRSKGKLFGIWLVLLWWFGFILFIAFLYFAAFFVVGRELHEI